MTFHKGFLRRLRFERKCMRLRLEYSQRCSKRDSSPSGMSSSDSLMEPLFCLKYCCKLSIVLLFFVFNHFH